MEISNDRKSKFQKGYHPTPISAFKVALRHLENLKAHKKGQAAKTSKMKVKKVDVKKMQGEK